MSSPSVSVSRTSRFRDLTTCHIAESELVIAAGDATENRGQLRVWSELACDQPSRIALVSAEDNEYVSIVRGEAQISLSLRDDRALAQMLSSSGLLLDVSGLPHHVWAPILKTAYSMHLPTRVLYAEPESYKAHPSPASATLFDLSVRFRGLAPLPGFVRLKGPPDEGKCVFVALLGFEGNRPERLLTQIDPTPKVIPIVGVPGFQIEYPAFTVSCNRDFLEDNRAHSQIRYARASCPFEAYSALAQIAQDNPDHYMYLAPIGTKPHALGAVLYAIANPDNTEIMFDHPVRKAGRTKGIGVIHIYDFGKFDGFRSR